MKNHISPDIYEQMVSWRHHLHQHPETGMKEKETAAYIAALLKSFGCEVAEGIGGTGVVGTLKNGTSEKVVGLRSDIDALPITEQTGCAYASENDAMHACGHDGHMAMLLGAAKALSEQKNFDGTVRFIFQPAEEITEGAQAMIRDNIFKRFPVDEIYGMHNVPFLPEGTIAMKPHGIMSGEDDFVIRIKGAGCHASTPYQGVDPFLCFTQIYQNLQMTVARQNNPVSPLVISCTELHTDGARNAIPANLEVSGDVRSFRLEDSAFAEERMCAITKAVCELYGAGWEVSYSHECRPILNNAVLVNDARLAAENVVGPENVNAACDPWMASEDFSSLLEHVPGCYILLGNHKEGTEAISLHSPLYDFNDDILPIGASYYVELVGLRLHL